MIVKRVKQKDFEREVEDKQTEGYKIEGKTDQQATLVRRTYGKAVWHIVIFLLTVWFTFGLGNFAYLLFSYFARAEKVIIKTE